jgi:outer membrane receptor protein involved in Fe transport
LVLAGSGPLPAQTTPPPTAPFRPAAEDNGKDAVVELSAFTVVEEKDTGYESMHTTSGMRTVQSLKNVANSISVMNAQLIEDTASLTMEEMSQWFVSGESNPESHAHVAGGARVVLRGVANAYAMRNGWIWYSPMDSYSTERVEILRGPNAFLYGEADIGGAQNQMTKRGLFTRDVTRTKIMLGNDNLRRGEIDFNRRLVRDKLAVRVSAVQSNNDSWQDNVRRDFRGVYAALTWRPFRSTTIYVMGEHAKATSVNSQGLFLDQFSRVATVTTPGSGGYVYVPATGLMYRAQGAGRINSTGSGTTIVDPTIVPKGFQNNGPNATYKNYYDSVTLEAEHHIGKNLHLQVTGNFYQMQVDTWSVSGRNVYRDLNRTLPNGQPNPYYNELYQEYYRTRNINGNSVRDARFSAVYDLETKWMKQQFVVNVQQHQDTPGQKKPKWGEYVDHTSPAWTGTINTALTQAAFTSNRNPTFTNNRFMRRYYFKDGAAGSADLGPVPGVSAWYPDLSNLIGATGQIIQRRFYTPSWGVGASGSYFKDHFFTLVGYRRDHFNMKTTVGTVRPLKNEWIVDEIPGAFAPNPSFARYKVDGANYGAIFRLNDAFAIGYNYAQSFRISIGDGNLSYKVGQRQGVPVGEGQDISMRLSPFKGRLEFSAVYYHNYSPNARFNPAPAVAIRDEISAIFPDTFYASGQDLQTTTTKGYEFEAVANFTRNWRLSFNLATNKVVTEDRAPLLKEFQAEAKTLGKPTPLLDDFLLTIPEGLPNPGYTKLRCNLFTRYTFTSGRLKGLYVGGGVNYRRPTYRGTADLDGIAATPPVDLWSPAYSLYSLLAGYQAKIFKRPTTFSLNLGNLLDKEYYRSGAIASGAWGEPRSWRLTVITDF